jgi:hypothetical protein
LRFVHGRVFHKLRAAASDLKGQISEALESIERPSAAALVKGIEHLFKRSPESEWRDHIMAVVHETTLD